MLRQKQELADKITRECRANISDPSFVKNYMQQLEYMYDIPTGISFDVLTLKKEAIDESEFILYCILSVIDSKSVDKYFTTTEISTYSTAKYKVKKVKFPIRLKMVQTAEDSWIGSITVKDLMMFRDAQLINYNENAQRTLKRFIAGGIEYYQIDLNRTAVNEIADAYREGRYIPNVITFNMPEDTEFEYDGDFIVIKSIKAFDILDGYHRYIAMSNVYNTNKKFDYTMELRIVCFSEEKARQFIWQEDQKTKMSKIDSDSLNQNNPANQVTQMLNQKGIFNGIINRNKGIIDAAEFSKQISILYFNTNKKITRSQIIQTRDILYRRLEALVSKKSSLLDKRWGYEYTVCALCQIANEDVDDDNLYDAVEKLYEEIKKPENSNIIGRNLSKANYTRLYKLYNEIK